MANREITYYSLLSSENLRHIEQMADTMDEQSFVTLGFEKKWFCHLWIGANNEAFIEYVSHQTDLTKLDMILGEQLKLYGRKQGEGFEQDQGDFYGTYKARKDWLNNTIFICRNEYNKTQNEVFNEVVKWCVHWLNEWLENRNQPKKIRKQPFEKFFIEDRIQRTQIDSIKVEFRALRAKKMAILIYLLQSEFEVIELVRSSQTKSRKSFFGSLSRTDNLDGEIEAINKVFVRGKNQIYVPADDDELVGIKNKLIQLGLNIKKLN